MTAADRLWEALLEVALQITWEVADNHGLVPPHPQGEWEELELLAARRALQSLASKREVGLSLRFRGQTGEQVLCVTLKRSHLIMKLCMRYGIDGFLAMCDATSIEMAVGPPSLCRPLLGWVLERSRVSDPSSESWLAPERQSPELRSSASCPVSPSHLRLGSGDLVSRSNALRRAGTYGPPQLSSNPALGRDRCPVTAINTPHRRFSVSQLTGGFFSPSPATSASSAASAPHPPRLAHAARDSQGIYQSAAVLVLCLAIPGLLLVLAYSSGLLGALRHMLSLLLSPPNPLGLNQALLAVLAVFASAVFATLAVAGAPGASKAQYQAPRRLAAPGRGAAHGGLADSMKDLAVVELLALAQTASRQNPQRWLQRGLRSPFQTQHQHGDGHTRDLCQS